MFEFNEEETKREQMKRYMVNNCKTKFCASLLSKNVFGSCTSEVTKAIQSLESSGKAKPVDLVSLQDLKSGRKTQFYVITNVAEGCSEYSKQDVAKLAHSFYRRKPPSLDHIHGLSRLSRSTMVTG